MQIAVIAWGSLIWCPGCLRIKTRWRSDGPALPIEFARISGDGRLTLVIHLKSPQVRTYWAVSELETLLEARRNLENREGTCLKYIHSLSVDGQSEGEIPPHISATIGAWLTSTKNVQAAIWTGLSSNWETKRCREFTHEDALQYVSELERAAGQAKATYDRAHEYISNAPSQTQTPIRKIVREKIGWADAELPSILFEAGMGKQK